MNRGTPLKRRTALRARRWGVSRGPSKRQRKQTRADKRYLEAVRQLPCCAPRVSLVGPEALEHAGEIHAHHAGRRPGTGMKAKDDTAIALCSFHHHCWHSGTGVFFDWKKADRRRWADAAIADTRRLVADAQLAGVA